MPAIAPALAESAYTNSFAGATSTTLYGIDSNLDILVLQNHAQRRLLNTVGPLGVNATSNIGFEIEPALNLGFAAMQVGGTSSLYRINLTTGAATVVGAIGGGHHLIGLAAVLFGASPVSTVTATGAAAAQINVAWSAVIGADHYDVYRQSSIGGGFVPVASVQTFAARRHHRRRRARPTSTKFARSGRRAWTAPDSGVDLGTAMAFTDDPLLVDDHPREGGAPRRNCATPSRQCARSPAWRRSSLSIPILPA